MIATETIDNGTMPARGIRPRDFLRLAHGLT